MFCSRCGTEVQEKSKFCPSCGLDLAAQTPLGRVSAQATAEKTELDHVRDALRDEYTIAEELGRGGMAIVYKARDKQLDRDVAIKVLPFSLAFDAEFVERFQREARTAAKLEHPAIIPIYRVGKTGRVIYFVMKFLRGNSLSELLEERGALSPEEIRDLLVPTASALGYAHRHGIVHRDIKPDNIMFDEMGHAVVTDFGIAKAASGTRLTGTGMSIGTPHYMSPEQARAQPLDGRSDIYSLGVVAFQCLVGRVPFDGEDAFSIGYKHIMEELEEPPLQTPEQRTLFQFIRRMMTKSPDDRYQTAEELAEELKGRASLAVPTEDVASAPTIALPAVAPKTTPTGTAARADRPSTPTTPMPRAEPRPPFRRPKKKKRGGLIAASVVLLLGGGGAGGYYYYANYVLPQGTLADSAGVSLDTTGLLLADSLALADSALADSLAADSAAVDTTGAVAVTLPDSGWLVVTGAPRGARYFVDGAAHTASRMYLPMGSYRLEVKATGYNDFSMNVAIARGDTLVQPVSLERAAQPVTTIVDRPPDTAPPRPAVRRAQCTSPTQPNYNLSNACYDALPRPLESPQVPLDASVQGTPTPVTVWVRVGADGRALGRTVATPSNDPAFTVLALQYALRLSYQPARKGDRPVEAWFQVRFFPANR